MAPDEHMKVPPGGTKSRLEALSVAVIGAGSIGAELMRNLGLMGVGRIDVYERSRAAADPLRSRYEVRQGDFWDELTLAKLQEYDFAVGTIDDRTARERLNQKCLVANTNLVLVWVEGPLAIVGAYPFGALPECACYECDPARVATPMQIASLRLSVGDSVDTLATNVAGASIAGAVAAALIARIAVGAHGSVARQATLDTSLGQGASIELRRDPQCPRCQALDRPVPIVHTRNRWAVNPTVAREYPATLSQSMRLSDRIEGLAGDAFSVGELAEHFGGGPIPAKFALTEVDGRVVCLDFEENPGRSGSPVARRTAARRHPSS